jgi:integrase
MDELKRDHDESIMKGESGPEMARSIHPPKQTSNKFGKADSRYWLVDNRLQFHDSVNYSARLQAGKKRLWFPLGSPNKRVAAAKAAEIYRHIQSQGINSALEHYKPKAEETAPRSATVGMLIEIASSVSSARRHSVDAYVKAFRRIVSEVMEIQSGRKFDAIKGGTQEWRRQVDEIKLASLLPADIQAWKNRRLREADGDPMAKRRAIVTVNSLIRNAKALLGKKILPFVEQQLIIPRPLPFDGVGMEKGPSLRYVSKIDAYAILARAKEALAESEPEAYKTLLLALVCGLRRSEIDHLLWRAFDFSRSLLRVENTEYQQLKSEDSAGEIDLNQATLEIFKGFRAQSPKSLFVIESPNPSRSKSVSRCYRCNAIFERVNAWLREQGVESAKPLHTMRKEIGSIIASEHGIFEASRYLRHSDIRITSAIYADKKKSVTPKAFAGVL